MTVSGLGKPQHSVFNGPTDSEIRFELNDLQIRSEFRTQLNLLPQAVGKLSIREGFCAKTPNSNFQFYFAGNAGTSTGSQLFHARWLK